MLHFVNKAGNWSEKTQNFVLLSFSLDIHKEIVFCIWGQIPTNWLNDEENDLDVSIHVNFNFTSISLKETVGLIVLKILQFFFVPLNHVSQLI